MTATCAKDRFNLDSTYFVAFEMAHEALKRGLAAVSDLNITQYRVLTKLAQASEPVNQGELGKLLGMKPNVVQVQEMAKPLAISSVFPKIFEGANSIDVKA